MPSFKWDSVRQDKILQQFKITHTTPVGLSFSRISHAYITTQYDNKINSHTHSVNVVVIHSTMLTYHKFTLQKYAKDLS